MTKLALKGLFFFGAVVLLFSIELTSHASPPVQTPEKLRVGVFVGEPFVIQQGDRFTGYSIDYWEKVASVLGVAFEYVPLQTQEQVVQGLNDGSLDLVIGALGMTAAREQAFDFTHSYFRSGLQILTLPPHQQSVFATFIPLLGTAILHVLGVALIFAIIMAHVIYFIERRNNPDFQQGYLRDIWEAFWYLLIIVATGEYGDRMASTPIRRVVTVIFWLLGVLFIAQFTATAASSLTVEQLTGGIEGPDDLPGKRIVTVAGTVAADYMAERHIPFTTVARIEEAYAQLEANQVDAVVFQAPILQYYAAHAGKGKVEAVGPVFRHLPIGMALPLGSSLRKPLNQAILKFYEDGTYEEVYLKWFGAAPP